MNSNEIRKRFLEFFQERGHALIPSASLIPENDPSVLFTTAGMQPLVPYFLGKTHIHGKRLANFQKVVRTVDINEVGDNTHLTFFEMMGNWSLGDYFKKEAIEWSFEFLTNKEVGLGLDPGRLYITVFEGDSNAPKDTEAVDIWKKSGISQNRIYYLGADANWWPSIKASRDTYSGPCGPSSEMFYDITSAGLGDLSHEEFIAADERQDVIEIWNDVFMEYEKKDGVVVGSLPQKNVDTGSGFERVVAVLQKKQSVFDTDLFIPIFEKINTYKPKENVRAKRIIADHIRAAVFLIADGVIPSNTDRGYILRRLVRRAIMNKKKLEIKSDDFFPAIARTISSSYQEAYPVIFEKQKEIIDVLVAEEKRFIETLDHGLKEFDKVSNSSDSISGKDAFILFSTFGFPLEMTEELAGEQNKTVDVAAFYKEEETHQKKSHTAQVGKFKGGLGGTSPQEIRYHTATHLLNAALHKVLGNHVEQRGSNITSERLRFDFSHSEKMTDTQKKNVEDLVNKYIQDSLDVHIETLPLAEAKAKGAIGVFTDKYSDVVSVYTIGKGEALCSIEICGGPHVKNTHELGHFMIKKEEASGKGIRRIKAVLE